MKLLNLRTQPAPDYSKEQIYRALLQSEADIGGLLFGPIPAGRRREFFYIDNHVWVWQEHWQDQAGKAHHQTVRYEIRPKDVLKSHADGKYQKISEAEIKKLRDAIVLYLKHVVEPIYGVPSPF